MNREIPAIVLGGGITLQGVIRCLGEAGIISYCPCPTIQSEKWSKWFNPIKYMGRELLETDDLADFLDKLDFDKAILFPCTDCWSEKVSELPEKLQNNFKHVVSSSSLQKLLTDKRKFSQLLLKHNVPHPETSEDTEKINKILQSNNGRSWFLKPENSQRFSEQFKIKGIMSDSNTELLNQLKSLSDKNIRMLLQEYIAGDSDRYFYVEGHIDKLGKATALFARKRLRMNPPDLGNSTIMESISLEEVTDAVETIKRFLSDINFYGIFSAEFKRDPRDGLAKLIEINARPWWYIQHANYCGINIPLAAYLSVLGEDVNIQSKYKLGKKFVNFFADFALWRDLKDKNVKNFFLFVRDWITSYKTTFSISDPIPSIKWSLFLLSRRVKDFCGKLL